MKKLLNAIRRSYSIPLLLVLWQTVVATGLIENRLLPSPSRIWESFIDEIGNGVLIHHTLVTVGRALTGFGLAVVMGVPFAALMARSRYWRNLFEPIFFFGYPVPKIALFPVFTYVFGIGSPSKISFTFLECLYPIVVTGYLGFRGIQTRLVWTAQNFGANRLTILRRVVIPASLPSIFTGLRVALPMSITIVVLTEMIGDSVGLGFYINTSSTRFAFANVYAAIFMIAVCGFLLDRILLLVRKKVLYWEADPQGKA